MWFSMRLVFTRMLGPLPVMLVSVLMLAMLLLLRRSATGRGGWRGVLLRLAVVAAWALSLLQRDETTRVLFWLPVALVLAFARAPVRPSPGPEAPDGAEATTEPPAGAADTTGSKLTPAWRWGLAALAVPVFGVAGAMAWFVLPLALLDALMDAQGVPAQGQGAAAAWVLMFSCPIGGSVGVALALWANLGGADSARRYRWALAVLVAMGLAIFAWIYTGVMHHEARKTERGRAATRHAAAQQPVRDPALYAAAQQGQTGRARQLLLEGAAVDGGNVYGHTPLSIVEAPGTRVPNAPAMAALLRRYGAQ